MNWNDYFLWAALILFIELFFHFLRQRTLWDKNSKVFVIIVVLGILHCLLGIALTRLQMFQLEKNNQIILVLAALIYLIHITLPFELLRFTLTMCHDYERQEKQITLAGFAAWVFGAILVIADTQTTIISFADQGLLRAGTFFEIYSVSLMIYFILNLCFALKCRKRIGKEETKALLEANAIAVLGLFIQQFLHIQLFLGFAMAIASLVLYILLKNPYAYIDEETNVFNANYFRVWMRDRENHWKGSLLVVDFHNLEYAGYIYIGQTEKKLIVEIAEQLNKLGGNLPMFYVSSNRFVYCSQDSSELTELTKKITHWLKQGVFIDNKNLKCRALLTEVDLEHTKNIKELKAYTDFLIRRALMRKDVTVMNDSFELKKRFDYELEVEHFLYTAIKKDLFQVWYQPVYSAAHKRYVSLEALSRLKHPVLGWISPELFIQIAVENGWATTITQLQLTKICRFIKENEKSLENIRNIKINLSPCELLEPGYCEKLLSIIRAYAIPFSKIQFEITETTATEYTQETFQFIRQLQKEGMKICLDDFGSGYANLNTVLSLPYSTVKMDRSLLRGICESAKKADFYRDLCKVIKKQGFLIVAEGVETEQEARLLSEWSIDFFQGYYFSKPLSDQEIIQLLEA